MLGWETIKAKLARSFSSTAILRAANTRLIIYFEKTWINGNYSIELISCRYRTLNNGLPRTNNVSEGGNNAINIAFGCRRPTLYTAIDKLRLLQCETDLVLGQLETAATNPPRQRKQWQTRENRIKLLLRTYNRQDVYSFLRNLGFLFANFK